MRHPFYKSIKGRFFLITIVLMLLVGIFTSVLSYRMYSENLTANLIHSAETNLHFLADSIDSSLNDIIALSDWCRNNSSILNFTMTSKDSDAYRRITCDAADRLIEEFLINHSNDYICRLVIANSGRDDYLQVIARSNYSADDPMPSVIKELPYYEKLLTAEHYDFSAGFQQDPFLLQSVRMIPLIRPLYHPYSDSVIGFIYVEVSSELFTDAAQKYAVTEAAPLYLSVGQNTYVVTPSDISQSNALDDLALCTDNVRLSPGTKLYKSASQNDLLYVTIPLKTEGCSLTLPISNNDFQEQLQNYYQLLLPILTLILLSVIFLITALSRAVTYPVHRLRKRLAAISGGDFSLDRSIEWENEFGDIGKNINQLAVDIHELIDEKVAYEKRQRDYEFQMLQSQINPHFLYNTLNSIKWMAAIQNAPGIAEMATALSHLLKNISKGTSTIVTIQDEITLLDDYFTIQKYRYGGVISLDYAIDDPTLLSNPTLRFTLQPIVENAIFHGIEPKGQNGHITIHIYLTKDKNVRIDISDDGIGMDADTIVSVLNGDSAKRSQFFRQLGISSVHRQIQYTFGEQYGLTITSEPGVYTTMSVLLPCRPAAETPPTVKL